LKLWQARAGNRLRARTGLARRSLIPDVSRSIAAGCFGLFSRQLPGATHKKKNVNEPAAQSRAVPREIIHFS
jgi:hypothetical protein